MQNILEKLVAVGFEKGKVTLVDLPAYLSNRCYKLNSLLVNLNSLLNEYKKQSNFIKNQDSSKLLIADQLGGISNILTKLSAETKQIVNFDHVVEKKIQQELVYNNIIPSEIVCFEQNEQVNVVSLVVRSIDYDDKKIVNVLNKVCSSKMKLNEVIPNVENNFICLTYKTAPTYNLGFGIAQALKGGEEVCGDTHSVMRLGDDKFLIAICDGMGHGEKANKASELSISMVENFYKAGYDSQTILTSINGLLNVNKSDVFSTIDISVVDLKSGETDFIKQGATIGFVKSGNNINEIKSNSLPVGVLDMVEPRITKTVLEADDILIMMSDGVVDAFSSIDEIKNFILYQQTKNPQELAKIILDKAKRNQKNYPKDDMTVLTGKLFLTSA